MLALASTLPSFGMISCTRYLYHFPRQPGSTCVKSSQSNSTFPNQSEKLLPAQPMKSAFPEPIRTASRSGHVFMTACRFISEIYLKGRVVVVVVLRLLFRLFHSRYESKVEELCREENHASFDTR